jgi:Tfp pilus assembly protein PilO
LHEEEVAVDQVGKLIVQYKGQRQLQEALSLILPLSQNVSLIIAEWSGLAQTSGLIVKSLSFKELPIGKVGDSSVREVGVLGLQARLSGPYEGIKSFIKNLETNMRIVDVQTLGIESGIKKSGDSMELIVGAHTYYQLEN